jgi:hypothetical protein
LSLHQWIQQLAFFLCSGKGQSVSKNQESTLFKIGIPFQKHLFLSVFGSCIKKNNFEISTTVPLIAHESHTIAKKIILLKC